MWVELYNFHGDVEIDFENESFALFVSGVVSDVVMLVMIFGYMDVFACVDKLLFGVYVCIYVDNWLMLCNLEKHS